MTIIVAHEIFDIKDNDVDLFYAMFIIFGDFKIDFVVYPCYKSISNNYLFYHKDSGDLIIKDDLQNLDNCEKLFSGFCRWNGEYDNRIYFEDIELCEEEFKTVFKVYEEYIKPYCKNKIKGE